MSISTRVLILISFTALFVFGAAAQSTGKNPVVIIPGVTGSQLVNPNTGKTVWFSTKRDKDDDIRLPMRSAILSRNRDSLIATDIIREIKLKFLPDVEVYQMLIDELKQKGYTEADWTKPQATDVFYVFPYDWRRDNVESAHLLMRKLAAVKRAVKRPGLKFDIVAHSMGGLIARYASMYGLADLPREGRTPVPNWSGAAHINKLMMFGTPNEGSFSAFQALLNGSPIVANRNLPFIDDLNSADVMASPSSFQLMPHRSTARFLDEDLKPIDVDLYDPENWFKYGWGAITDPKFLSKLKDADVLAKTNSEIKPEKPNGVIAGDDLILSLTSYAQVRAYFISALSRAKRFHAALDVAVDKSPVELYVYGGNCEQTLSAVVLLRNDDKDKGKWTTLIDARDIKTASGKEIKKDVVKEAIFTKGDGRVTTSSLTGENVVTSKTSIAARVLPLKDSFFACGRHTQLFLEKPIKDSFLSALVVETQSQP